MRKYAVIYKSVLIENFQYVMNIAMGFISYFIFIFIFIRLWDYIYDAPGALIAGYTKEQMIWYVMITEMMWFGSGTAAVSRQAAGDVRGGSIAYHVNKPYHYAMYILTKYAGECSVKLPMYAALAVAIGVFMVGMPPGFKLTGLFAGILSMLLGITINAVFKLSISLFSFWIEDSTPFQWLYDKLLLIVGTIFPIEIFPAALQPIFKLTPIYTVCYGPAKLFIDFSPEKFLEIFTAQIIYLVFGITIMLSIYGKGVKKLYVNGG